MTDLQVSMTDDGSDRLSMLSKPRKEKTIWWTRFGPRVTWGDQSPIEPISRAALTAEASERVRILATPKKNFQTGDEVNRPQFFYSCGRASQILETSPAAMRGEASERVTQLAKPKSTHPSFIENRPQYTYSCGRASVLWQVNPAAMKCPDRQRTVLLSRHKPLHREFQPNKEVQTMVSEKAMAAKSTPRIDSLAEAKERDNGPYRDPIWLVSTSAQNTNASNRSLELAKPKSFAEGYLPNREVQWQVARSARRAVASTRISQLSQPIVRASMDHLQFNPEAFAVTQNALKGTIPSRIAELAQPIVR